MKASRGAATAAALAALFCLGRGGLSAAWGQQTSDRSAAVPHASAPATAPAAAAWMALPPDRWPNIVLVSTIRMKGHSPWHGITGFAMRLPGGQTVVVCPAYSVVQNANIDDLKGSIQSWSMGSGSGAALTLNLSKPATPPSRCAALNCVMLCVESVDAGDAQVLVPSPDPVRVGQKIYFVGRPLSNIDNGSTAGPQTVFPGVVLQLNHPTPGLIAFSFASHADPKSFQGGALLDEQGRVIGLQRSWYPEHTSGDVIIGEGMQIGTLLAAVTLPPERTRAGASARLTGTAAENAPAENPADKALRVAQMYEASEQYGPARNKLQQVIDQYPNTPAAAKARAELQQIQGK